MPTLSIPEKIKARNVKNSKFILNNLIKSFEKPEILEDAMIKTFLDPLDVPQSKYSRLNRIMLFIQGAQDARGNRAWLDLKRHPLDWTKQNFILVPLVMKIKDKKNEEEEITITKGFKIVGLYDYSNTYGKDLPEYEKIKAIPLPALVDVAEKWGIKTEYSNSGQIGVYGSYSQSTKEIKLNTKNTGTFFHELAHAAHDRIDGKLKGGQDPKQEIIAQLVSGVLCRMYDQKMDHYTYDYILAYANDDPLKAMQLITKVLSTVTKILELILVTTSYQKEEAIKN